MLHAIATKIRVMIFVSMGMQVVDILIYKGREELEVSSLGNMLQCQQPLQ